MTDRKYFKAGDVWLHPSFGKLYITDDISERANSDFHLMNWTKSLDQYYQRQQTRAELLAIAAELEAL
jgi:hypothetical protein